jgi:hypothetical protein
LQTLPGTSALPRQGADSLDNSGGVIIGCDLAIGGRSFMRPAVCASGPIRFSASRRSITSANHNVAFCSRDLVFVLNATVLRIPPESNCMRDRINPFLFPPSLLVSHAM